MACLETYVTLRIFSESQHPDEISRVICITPTFARPMDAASRYSHEQESHHWAWSTKGLNQSTDGIEHVSAVIKALVGKEAQLDALRAQGCEIDICCYWVSSVQGGPFLDRSTLSALAGLGLEIWWDVYFAEPSEYAEVEPLSEVTTGEQSHS